MYATVEWKSGSTPRRKRFRGQPIVGTVSPRKRSRTDCDGPVLQKSDLKNQIGLVVGEMSISSVPMEEFWTVYDINQGYSQGRRMRDEEEQVRAQQGSK